MSDIPTSQLDELTGQRNQLLQASKRAHRFLLAPDTLRAKEGHDVYEVARELSDAIRRVEKWEKREGE